MTRKNVTFETGLGTGLGTGLALLVLVLGVLAVPGSAWAQPREVCDGIDNDGNGLIDEGFDTDGDGVARCCNKDPFFVTTNTARTELVAHHSACSPGTPSPNFAAGPQPLAEFHPSSNSMLRINAVGDFLAGGPLEVIWTEIPGNLRNITMCNGIEWVTEPYGKWTYPHYFGGADHDQDGKTDLTGWDAQCCYVGGSPTGSTAFHAGFIGEQSPTYTLGPLAGEWGIARTYNQEDVNSDGCTDLAYHSYANGGASQTDIWFLAGNCTGSFAAPAFLGSIGPGSGVPAQPQNWGDLGDIDPNGSLSGIPGCTDWVGGPDDDGNRGSVYALFGDCNGNFGNATQVADACVGCTGSGSWIGAGMSQLYDWSCDGRLDLLTSHVVNTGSTSTVTYYDGVTGPPVVILNNQPIRIDIASPLRN
ncbi:MAG: hypothetical protein K0U98_23305 [Deltaproteobacteria bacterium]|nr:hypothetical protein [Deltaproteobacteria bacterium]